MDLVTDHYSITENAMSKTVLVLAPHPDDAEFYAGGTIAKEIQQGSRVVIIIATDGRCGSFEYDSQTLSSMRVGEAQRAAQVLGAERPIMLGYPDLELDTLPPGKLREQFVRLIRQHKPDMVIAEDPFARYEIHPDHRAVAWASMEAVNYASLPLWHPEHLAEGLEPHFTVEKLYYSEEPSSTNHVIDITDTLDRKLQALAEHKSQISFLVEDVLRQAHIAGVDLGVIAGDAIGDPLAMVTFAIQSQAADIGQKIGVQFGEAYRYVRFHPYVENLITIQRRPNS